STKAVTKRLLEIFARFGIPLEFLTDGGPQFASEEFAQFTRQLDILHVISSSHFARSNGLAESGVKVVKKKLIKAKQSSENIELALMNYRATPLNNGKSPSQWLFGYNIRTLLPTTQPGKEVPYATARPKNFGRRRLRPLETGE